MITGANRFPFQAVLGNSPEIQETVRVAQKVALARTTVLLVGPTGTGKELFARGIHYSGPTSGEPFVPVNCAAIPPGLLESELFGHERGSFTDARTTKEGLFEVAREGTLFLDEVTELPIALQPKLLRALEERMIRRLGGTREIPIRCRVVAASNRNLEDALARGDFREDLFYRLNVVRLVLPPLRERLDDIPIIAEHYLRNLPGAQTGDPKRLSAAALAAMRVHGWPGNIRELKNVIERAAVLSDGPEIGPEHLMIQRRIAQPATHPAAEEIGAAIRIPPGGRPMEEIEREAIRLTLEITRGNRKAAAEILGIHRHTLVRKLGESPS
ncbi:MAG TPA: sigma-54 dependent transcriptional regulator [Longimicrobium sp.]|nr:sigma-54 dependent transcriptional regulator [Longimicrobium sp.]